MGGTPRRLGDVSLGEALYTAHWNHGSHPHPFGELERVWVTRAEDERARPTERRHNTEAG